MYNTSKILNRKEVDRIDKREIILNRVSEYDIFAKYIGNFKIGHIYNSPLREDKNPSFGIFSSRTTGRLLYKDLSDGDCGDIFKFVKRLKGFTTYREAIDDIYNTLNVSYIHEEIVSKKSHKVVETAISVTRKPFNDFDNKFWESFNISKNTLELFKVNAISKCIVNNLVKATYSQGNPMYCYKIFNKFKIYRPFGTKLEKWKGNLGPLDIQGYEQLPASGDLLIITKSLKDVMVLHELGFTSIAPPSESTMIPEIVMNNLKSRFKRIIVFYDRDKAGFNFTRKIVKIYNLDFMFINKKYKKKDISDFIKHYGLSPTVEILHKMTN